MGLFSRRRYAVSALVIGLEGRDRLPVYEATADATERIVASEGDFAVTAQQIARVAEVLLEHEVAWSQAANWGEIFRREEDAGSYGEECFNNLAGRYLSDGAGSGEEDELRTGGTSLVMFTIAYEGEVPEIEKTLATRQELETALRAIITLARSDRLLLAHIHQSPGTKDEVLSEDQLLVNYPELLSL